MFSIVPRLMISTVRLWLQEDIDRLTKFVQAEVEREESEE